MICIGSSGILPSNKVRKQTADRQLGLSHHETQPLMQSVAAVRMRT